LVEINLSGRGYTWSNNQQNQILSYIDRVFYSTEFDCLFPLVTTKVLPRAPSDHVPILWEFGQGQSQNRSRFKFEKWWLQHEDFGEMVIKVCDIKVVGDNALDRWQNKVRLFRRKARGWSANVESELRKKERFSREYESLDVVAENRSLSDNERDRMKFLYFELNKIWGVEEPRAREREIKEGVGIQNTFRL
jgi:hypothetical protein